MAEPASGGRKRSSILLIAALAAVVVVGVFVAGFLVGGASTGPPATSTTATTAVACTSASSRCLVINSNPSDTVIMGSPFSFTVTTGGMPVTKIKKRGRLPRGVRFEYNHNGTATISGTPRSTQRKSAVGTYPLTINAVFGKGKTKQVVTQAFTLKVVG